MSKFSDATFYLAPSGYKEGILFPQKPLSTNGEITFTRAGSAWRTNIEGQVEETCYNLLQYSEDITNGVWFSNGGTIVSNAGIAPDGTLTADSYTNSTYQIVRQLVTLSTNTTYTFSFYAKNVNATDAFYRVYNNTNATDVVSVTSFISQINTSTWSRVTLTFTTNTTGTEYAVYLCSGQQNGTILFWGSQLVRGSLPRPYLSTTTRQNFPRVDYSLGTGTFLLEPQRTNLLLNSGWTGGGTTPTAWNSFITGTTTAVASIKSSSVTAYRFSATSQRAFFAQSVGATIGATYSLSVYCESVTTTLPVNEILSGGSIVGYYKNGVSITGTTNIEAGNFYSIILTASATGFDIRLGIGVGANVTADIVLSMPQFEQGAYSTSFILTPSGATATRIADSFSRGNIYTNNLVSASGGTWFAELKTNLAYKGDAPGDGIFLATAGNIDNFRFYNSDSAPLRLQIYKRVGGVNGLLYTTTTDNAKVAIKWNGSTADVFENGVKVVSATAFTSTQLQDLYTAIVAAPKFIQQMGLWNTPLTDAQCVALTL